MQISNKRNLMKITILSLVFALCSTTISFGATGLDLSASKIISKNGDYYFKIPVSWENYIYAKREASEGYAYFDKIDFYYKHKDMNNKDVKFLTLYTYYKDDYTGYTGQKKILSTDKYIFTTATYPNNPYSSVNDRIIFSRFLIEIDTPNFISSKIYISADKPNIVQSGTLTVNNKIIDTKPIKYNNEVFLPVRDVAEKLGYDVSWNANNKNIVLSKGSKNVTIPTKNAKTLNKNGKVFVPISVFMQKLNLSVDIDSNNNIKIKG